MTDRWVHTRLCSNAWLVADPIAHMRNPLVLALPLLDRGLRQTNFS